MSMLLLRTFFIDQVQLLSCEKYIQAKDKRSRLSVLFETVRSYFCMFFWEDCDELYKRVGWNYNEWRSQHHLKRCFNSKIYLLYMLLLSIYFIKNNVCLTIVKSIYLYLYLYMIKNLES